MDTQASREKDVFLMPAFRQCHEMLIRFKYLFQAAFSDSLERSEVTAKLSNKALSGQSGSSMNLKDLPRTAKALVAVICTPFWETPPTCPLASRLSQVSRPGVCRKVTLFSRAKARLPMVSSAAIFTSSAPLLAKSCVDNNCNQPKHLPLQDTGGSRPETDEMYVGKSV